MPLTEDDTLFAPLARAFAVRYVTRLAGVLHRQKTVAFDLTALDAEAKDLLFDLCLIGAAQYEDQFGFDQDGRRYVPRPSFEIRGVRPADILIGKMLLRAAFEDEVLDAGIARAQAMLRDTQKPASIREREWKRWI